jgi:SPP1 family predicted phage head-tail adaptor
MSAGELRHYAELQKKTVTADGMGGEDIVWSLDRHVWCHIRPISGVQRMESMRRNSKISHEIKARYNADLTPEKRIVYRGRAFNIEAAWSPDELREYTMIMASEGVAT